MRILMLIHEYPPLEGGGGVAAQKLANGFIENNHKVDIITTYYKSCKKYEQINGINIHRVKVLGRNNIATASLMSWISFPITLFFKAIKLCKKHRYDLINTHFAIPSGPVGIIISRLFKTRHILSILGADIYDPTRKISPHNNKILNKVVQWTINKSDIAIAESSDIQKNANKYYKIEKDIKIIPLPYEVIKFKKIGRKELKLNPNKKYTVSVGRMVKRKGYDYLIKSIALLKDIEALIIGEGPEIDNLKNLAKELNISSRIHFLGFVSEEKKFQYLDNADVYVLSSLHEGFGIVLQEAMQVDLPIVATNHGGQVDIIKNGVNGYLVPPKNPEAIKNGILKALDKEKLKKKGFITRFSPKRIAKEYTDLLLGHNRQYHK